MKKALSAVFALAILAGATAGCTDSNQTGKVGENRNREQPPAASPSTDSGTLGSAPGGSGASSSSTDASRSTPQPPPTR